MDDHQSHVQRFVLGSRQGNHLVGGRVQRGSRGPRHRRPKRPIQHKSSTVLTSQLLKVDIGQFLIRCADARPAEDGPRAMSRLPKSQSAARGASRRTRATTMPAGGRGCAQACIKPKSTAAREGMTLLNIGLCSSTLLPNWDQASGTDWGKSLKGFGAIGRRWGEGRQIQIHPPPRFLEGWCGRFSGPLHVPSYCTLVRAPPHSETTGQTCHPRLRACARTHVHPFAGMPSKRSKRSKMSISERELAPEAGQLPRFSLCLPGIAHPSMLGGTYCVPTTHAHRPCPRVEMASPVCS
ncbi:hypothetical protein B0I37DRAFT_124699 [Chaetomium sp. MPI-CAGE-AT-0009]|nr:hypothetical protein B0I37DRAFT_124699 [Chaetomium sp. MPI-CAGE-AT-0009]